MPLTCDWNGPALTWSVSLGPVSRSIRWPPGSELTRSDRRRAGTVVDPSVSTLPGDPVDEADLEVRRRQAQAAVLGLEQDVGEHGQRAPVGDRSAHDPEAARQVLLHHRELHVRALQGRVGSGSAMRIQVRLRRAGLPAPAKPRQFGVRIFLDLRRSVTIIIMLWTRWTGTLRPVRRRRGRGPAAVDGADQTGGRRPGSARWTNPAGASREPVTSDRLSTPVVPAVRHCVHVANSAPELADAPDSHRGTAGDGGQLRAPERAEEFGRSGPPRRQSA